MYEAWLKSIRADHTTRAILNYFDNGLNPFQADPSCLGAIVPADLRLLNTPLKLCFEDLYTLLGRVEYDLFHVFKSFILQGVLHLGEVKKLHGAVSGEKWWLIHPWKAVSGWKILRKLVRVRQCIVMMNLPHTRLLFHWLWWTTYRRRFSTSK